MRAVVVFDTNILLSGIGWRGSPYRCLELTQPPDDDKVVECAVVGGATHIVTGDRRHLLTLGSYQGIAIVSAAAFLSLVSHP